MYTPNSIISRLSTCISLVSNSIACYCSDPVSDFTRRRKLPADVLIHYLIQCQSKATKSELCEYFDSSLDIPSDSALCQQRKKLDPLALKRICKLFTRSFEDYKKIKGYYILACDGSDINIPFDKNDKETLCQRTNQKPYSQFHLNALYDCLNEVYWDVSIDSASKKRECDALISMLKERNYPSNSIIIADRGYERYNLMAHCIESNQKYLIRVKDINSNGILHSLQLPNQEFDINVKKKLTYNQSKKYSNDYTLLSNCSSRFDFFAYAQDEYEIKFRVVRFKITEDTYECLVTNLSQDEFNMEELKRLYHLRWNEETSFRTLKYTIGMINFHSKKRMFLKQEIYARIILFNLSNILTNRIKIKQKEKWKDKMKINQSAAVTNIRLFLNNRITEQELITRLKKYLVPIRPDRKFKRNMKPKSVVPTTYKAS